MGEPSRPAVTTPQVAGILIAGIPIVAQLLHVFGVYDLTLEQQAALGNAVQWGTIAAGALFGADAALRAARNQAHAKVEAQAMWRTPPTPLVPPTPPPASVPAPTPPVAPKPRKRATPKPKGTK